VIVAVVGWSRWCHSAEDDYVRRLYWTIWYRLQQYVSNTAGFDFFHTTCHVTKNICVGTQICCIKAGEWVPRCLAGNITCKSWNFITEELVAISLPYEVTV